MKLRTVLEKRAYVELTRQMILRAAGGEAKLKQEFKGRSANDVYKVLVKAANDLIMDLLVKHEEVGDPDYSNLMDWCDSNFEAKVNEARREDLTYIEKQAKGVVEKVIVELKSHEAGKMTKLAQRFLRFDEAIKRMSEKRAELNAEVKLQAEDLFDLEDEVLTRVIATTKATMTLSKRTKQDPKKTINIDGIIAELAKLIPLEQVQEIFDAYTLIEAKEDKSPALTIRPVKEGAVVNYLKSLVAKVSKSVSSWLSRYDAKLKAVTKMIDAL